MKRIVKSRKGSGYPLVIAILFMMLLLFLCIAEYFRLTIIVQGIRDGLQDATIAVVTENYNNVYHGTREGYAGGYQPVDQTFVESIHYGDIYSRLENVLGVTYNGNRYEKRDADGALEYTLSGLRVEIDNIPMQSHNSSERFMVDGYLTVEIPISFIDRAFPNLKLQIKTSGGYSPQF